LVYLNRRLAPPIVYVMYLRTLLAKLRRQLRIPNERLQLTEALDRNGEFTTRWFDNNAVEWMRIFERHNILEKQLRILEIGSWEGRSTVFLLHYLPGAEVTSVDTWKGNDEHADDPRLSRIERLFDSNVARFGSRSRKVKSSSFEYFCRCGQRPQFDLVYVDGSHHPDDVLVDAIRGFGLLKKEGLIIFDDYIWERGPSVRYDPARAINCFLRMKRREYEIVSVTAQIVLKKLTQ
jgi:predicted O-methyltransferase YrrM